MIKVILISIIIGLLSIIVLGAIFGDVDDNWWMFFIGGVGVGSILGFAIKDKTIRRKLGLPLILVCLVFALLFIVYGIFGIIFNRDMLSGNRYDGMAGAIPYLVIFFSLIPMFLAFTVKLFLRKK